MWQNVLPAILPSHPISENKPEGQRASQHESSSNDRQAGSTNFSIGPLISYLAPYSLSSRTRRSPCSGPLQRPGLTGDH